MGSPQAETMDRTAKLLSVMAGMGMPGPLVSALLEMGGHRQTLDDARFLRGPIIYHSGPSNWGETIPKWMFDQVRSERVEISTGQLRMPVGPTEIACVMYPATMEAPLHYLAAELYLWASTHAAARHSGKPVEHFWKQLGRKPIPDSEVLKPGGLLHPEYTSLVAEIRRKVITAQEQRERGEKRHVKEEAKAQSSKAQRPPSGKPRETPLALPPPSAQNRPPTAIKPRSQQPPPLPPPRPNPRRPVKRPSPKPGLFSWLWKRIAGG